MRWKSGTRVRPPRRWKSRTRAACQSPVAAPVRRSEGKATSRSVGEVISACRLKSRTPLASRLRLIPPGEFTLGCGKSERGLFKNEGNEAELKQQLPAFSVKLTSPYRIGTTEVTVGQFRRFIADATYKTEAEDADGIGGDILDKGKHEWKKGHLLG